MRRIALNQLLLAHDLSGVRRLALLELASQFPDEVKYVDQAAEVFFNARSDVTENFYSDTTACLEGFHSLGIKVGVLTNGSADLHKCEFLKNILSVTFTAADIGASKPSPIGFMACAQVLCAFPTITADAMCRFLFPSRTVAATVRVVCFMRIFLVERVC